MMFWQKAGSQAPRCGPEARAPSKENTTLLRLIRLYCQTSRDAGKHIYLLQFLGTELFAQHTDEARNAGTTTGTEHDIDLLGS
jgi:hypothetical protein